MNHKRLEQKLKDKNKLYLIKFIETLEQNPADSELIIENNVEISGSPVIDGMIMKYLKDIGVKIKYSSNVEEDKRLLMTSGDYVKKSIRTCNGESHFIIGSSVKVKRIKAARIKAPVFTLGEDYYVVCTKCMDFDKL
jgi:hypothetical protein